MAVPAPSASRVLVVDDEEFNRDILARRLRRRGYEVDTAASGAEALGCVARSRYDIIVLDVMMPGMDGLAVLQVLRRTWSKLELPILMATALDASEDEVEALRLGANDYVTKPIDFAQLAARLDTHLGLRREFVTMRGEAARKIRSTDDMTPGTVLDGRYEIEERVGQGGYAVVYRALQLSTGQRVAIKVLRAHRAMRSGQGGIEYARFRREMQVIGAVRHPAIVQLIDSGSLELEGGWAAVENAPQPDWSTVDDGTLVDSRSEASAPKADPGTAEVPYFVMEYLEGETLAQRLSRDGPMSLEQALELFFPVIEGVHALHRRGIVHRDLKPSNIFLHRSDHRHHQPKVLDFGIAKLNRDDSPSQATIGFVGTPSYMSPEQALGERNLDARCDQYALAVMLYECLSGRRPFAAENYTQVLLQVTSGEFISLKGICDVPEQVDATVTRAMSREPHRRFTDLEAFGNALLMAAPESVRSRWGASMR